MDKDLQKTTLYLSRSDKELIQKYYSQRGTLSQIVRALLHRHVERLESRTAEHVGEQLTEVEIQL